MRIDRFQSTTTSHQNEYNELMTTNRILVSIPTLKREYHSLKSADSPNQTLSGYLSSTGDI